MHDGILPVNFYAVFLFILPSAQELHCDVSDAITDLRTWNISPSMKIEYILLCIIMFITCIYGT